MSKPKPCKACPWMKKNQPDITDEARSAMENGEWFCCHVRMGTCIGAKNLKLKHDKDVKENISNRTQQS